MAEAPNNDTTLIPNNVEPVGKQTPLPEKTADDQFAPGGLHKTVDFVPEHHDDLHDFSLDDTDGEPSGLKTPSSITEILTRDSVEGFTLLREVGRGGMGVVYEAIQKSLSRTVALKMILSGEHAGVLERERFRREAEAIAALHHTNIVQVFEVGEASERPYFAMEFVPGGSLASHLDGTPWPSHEAANLIEVLARAMYYAHQMGIVHRDLKPGNILISERSFGSDSVIRDLKKEEQKGEQKSALFNLVKDFSKVAKITDFGLAKRVEPNSDWSDSDPGSKQQQRTKGPDTRSGAVMGTPSYIAPEQAAGKNRTIGPAADIYALGAILYELLTGRPPFRGETALDTVLQVISDDPVPPSKLRAKLPRDLETICLKCLRKDPMKRYLNAEELAEDLARFQKGSPIAARPISVPERVIKWSKRHPAATVSIITTSIAILVMFAVSVGYNIQLQEANDQIADKVKIAEDALLEAKREKELADEAQKKEAIARRDAENNQRELERKKAQADRGVYALQLMHAATAAERDPERGDKLLKDTKKAPREFRDFTWSYLKNVCQISSKPLGRHVKGNNPEPVAAAAMSPNGKYSVTGGQDNAVRVWNHANSQEMFSLEGHSHSIYSITWSPDSYTIATADMDGNIHIYELPLEEKFPKPGKPTVKLKPWFIIEAKQIIRSVAFDFSGEKLAFGGDKGEMVVYNVPAIDDRQNNKPTKFASAKTMGKPINVLTWSAHGICIGADDGTVALWDPIDQDPIEYLSKQEGRIVAMDMTIDGEILAVAHDQADDFAISVIKVSTGKELFRLRGHSNRVFTLKFSADGLRLASGARDGTLRLWDTTTGAEKGVYRHPAPTVRAVALDNEGKQVVTGDNMGIVRLWDFSNQNDEFLNLANQGIITGVLSSSGNCVIVEDKRTVLTYWRLDQRNPQGKLESEFRLLGAEGKQTELATNADGTWVASTNGRNVYVWDVPKGAKGANRAKSYPLEARGLSIQDDLLVAALGEKGIAVVDLKTGKIQQVDAARGSPKYAALTPDQKHLVAVSGTGIQILAKVQRELPLPGKDPVTIEIFEECANIALAQTKDFYRFTFGRGDIHNPWTLTTCDEGGHIGLWNPVQKEGKIVGLTPKGAAPGLGTSFSEPLRAVLVSPDGQTVITGGADRMVRTWDYEIGQERVAFAAHNSIVISLAMDGRGNLLSLGGDGVLRIWHTDR